MSEASSAAAPAAPPALDDLMLAMDIVDTLRHDMRIAERELDDGKRRADMKKRLGEIYASQGISVPDDMLEEGVRALEQDRFTYKSRATGLQAGLARLYVKRGKLGLALGVLLLAGAVGWAGWYFGLERPRLTREAAVAAELARGGERLDAALAEITTLTPSPALRERAEALAADGRAATAAGDQAALARALDGLGAITAEAKQLAALPARIDTALAAIRAETVDDSALTSAAALEGEAKRALAAFDGTAASGAAGKLEALLALLRQSYEIRIVQADEVPSGVWRIPEVNPTARNHYLIVEAVGPDGVAIAMPVTSEESRKTSTVKRWGVRVGQDIFDAVRRDKSDDGIIQNDRVAEKKRGMSAPEWAIPAPPGAITEW
jgi:hypothetical protein